MGERLLRLHMIQEGDEAKARAIAETLSKKFYHHGYPLSRSEAGNIGLKVKNPPADVEDLLWRIWLDAREEIRLREPFNPHAELANNPDCAPLFAPIAQVNIPANLPPPLAQQVFANVLQQIQVVTVPPTPYTLINALIESPRLATRFVSDGQIFATRQPDLTFKVAVMAQRAHWRTLDIPQ
jgi:hypothetical protein